MLDGINLRLRRKADLTVAMAIASVPTYSVVPDTTRTSLECLSYKSAPQLHYKSSDQDSHTAFMDS